ncbi:envelope stress response membrane protein PspC [Allosphingosinicella deserti]|jgi:phage shock protein C|uniref:Envelope stress response membrane protein PspC n=1 Tax=Allosphingosinicella deserti TaxID=2116704 RepID=A0A2P7QN86_9SPHN|nr:envelope stress response membrane protein PspC [Sphingomonas deserti]PSJ39416.1 envelope stress response membrane protein PspC [Sphingomonas deserti]
MTPRHTKFYLDKQNKKWMGVCAGIADYTGIDVTLVRIGMVILTLLGSGMTVLAYLAAAWLAPNKPHELKYETPEQAKFWQGVRASPARTVRDVRSRFRELDRRLADVETYVTSSHGRLAREIEQLR